VVEGSLREGSVCGPVLPFERDVDGGHVLLEERSKGGHDIGIVGYECKEGVWVVLIGGSGGKSERRGGHMGGQSGRMGVDDSDGARGRWIKQVVRVLLVLGGGGALLGPVGGVGWFMVVVVVREELKR
jgi:hypothetical protein